MKKKKISSLRIGDFEVNPPIIQGGMGVRVSKRNLAAAVANNGCVGVVSTVGLGKFEDHPGSKFLKLNEDALRIELQKTREMTKGIIGVNVMKALSNYESLTRTAAEENVDIIISGAGFPSDLPEFVENNHTKLIPIISSAKALGTICKRWKRYNRIPDAVVVEGMKAGGHLGYTYNEVATGEPTLENILKEVIELANSFTPSIPVIAAGGIFDGKDIARVLKLGASGVQMATRFVCTHECDANIKFKEAFIKAKKGDITIIPSPVGMPGRVINNRFVERILKGETIPFKCSFKCLRSCNPKTAPYCIAKVLVKAAEGRLEESFAFAGSNAYRCDKIISVKELIDQLVKEAEESL